MLNTSIFKHHAPFKLEAGGVLPEVELAYQALGQLNTDCSNVIWVCHAFTGSQDVADWWQGLVGKGKLFDPEQYFIICVNVLGSHYGSTGPLSINPETGEPYFHTFPTITIRDIVNSFDLLREHLGISKIKTCVGGSLGGQQAVEWAISQPELIENLILIATNAQHSPWGIAFNESQRMSIEVDPTWTESHPLAGINGMKAARATALISYRNYETYGVTQARREEGLDKTYRAVTYQRYQGEKLAQRFNAFSYYVLSQVMDSQDVGRGRGGVINALGQVKAKTLVMGIKSDALFPINEQEFLAKHIPDATFQALDSLYGHDGFLIENELITKAIKIWQKFIKLDVNPMYSFFKALEDRPRTLVAHD
ncbi:homoserine O-acetyltransferase [Emticicia sp. ODNR4P]|nr:homoserine O-acetyltransferase [Emticicia sp. ODNR4P]